LLLPRLAGRRRAARYLLLGEPFGAQEALEAGIVSHVVEEGDLDGALGRLVGELLAKPSQALRLTQSLLRHATEDEVLERMALENSHFSDRLKSPEVAQAITAFFQRKTTES
jgi:enoyl-CoA hydratase/carnithine racemase